MDEVVKGLLLKGWGILEPPTGDPVTALQRILRGRAANLTTREVESLRPTPKTLQTQEKKHGRRKK